MTEKFAIIFKNSNEALTPFYKTKDEATFWLKHKRSYAVPESDLHKAYVGELGVDFDIT